MDFIQSKPYHVTSNFPIPQAQPKPIVASPFFMFLADQKKIIKDQDPNAKLIDLVTSAIKEWDQTMSVQDEYAAKFLEESEKIEAVVITNPQIQPQTCNFLDRKGNPVPPKKPRSAYLFYHKDNCEQMRRENPNLGLFEVSRKAAEMWMTADQQTRSFYEAKAQESRELYKQQLAIFEAKYGKVEEGRRAKKAGVKRIGALLPMNNNSDSD